MHVYAFLYTVGVYLTLFLLCHDQMKFLCYISWSLTGPVAYFGTGSQDLSVLYVNMLYVKTGLEALMYSVGTQFSEVKSTFGKKILLG